MQIKRVLVYSDFYPDDELDIAIELRRFSKETLVKLVSILGINYGNASFPNYNFFSPDNKRTSFLVEKKFNEYCRKNNCTTAYYCTYKTTLELLRHIYSIKYEEFSNSLTPNEAEYLLFKILLKINEGLYGAVKDADTNTSMALYYSYYVMNDMVNLDMQQLYLGQLYYGKNLFEFLMNRNRFLYEKLLNEYEIPCWQDYVSSLCVVTLIVLNFVKEKKEGLLPIDLDRLNEEVKEKTKNSILKKLCISIEKDIPYENKDGVDNVDYRYFRKKPLISVGDGTYLIYNFQVLVEQLYNSLVFKMFKELWNKNEGDFFQYYNKQFVEEYLFHRVMLYVVYKSRCHNAYFPSKEIISSITKPIEKRNQPDFYCREGEKLIVFECKSIMLKGSLKEKGSIVPLFEELKMKLYDEATESVVVKQLAKHIQNIENNNFIWDNRIPKKKYYYPVFVLGDMKMVQPGLMSIVNDWFYEELEKKGLSHVSYKPIIIVSIDILFLYSNLFNKKGLGYYINRFLKTINAKSNQGKWQFNIDADFNAFMKSYKHSKGDYFLKYTKQFLKKRD